jgi:hypothetical protein
MWAMVKCHLIIATSYCLVYYSLMIVFVASVWWCFVDLLCGLWEVKCWTLHVTSQELEDDATHHYTNTVKYGLEAAVHNTVPHTINLESYI